MAEDRDRLGYGTALLALFLSSVLQTVLFLVATAAGVRPGLLLTLIAGTLVGALLLRLCLGQFGWTISLKAAVLCRLLCGFAAGLVVGLIVAASSGASDDGRGFAFDPLVFLAASVLELLISSLAITFFARPLEEIDPRPAWTPRSPDSYVSSAAGDSGVYTHDQFLADLTRAERP